MAMLQVECLKKIYTTRFGGNQVQALSDVSFSVETGEYVAIIGFGEDHAAEYTRSPRPADQRKSFSGWKRFDNGQGTGNCSVPAG